MNNTIPKTSIRKTLVLLVCYLGLISLFRLVVVSLGLPRSLIAYSIWPLLILPHIYSRKVVYTLLSVNLSLMILIMLEQGVIPNAIASIFSSGIMIAIISEITFRFRQKQQDLNSNLREATTQATKADEAKGMFLANMSHEIRTPISGIIGVTDMLRSEKLTERQMELLNIVADSSDVLLHIVNNILDYSKIEAGKLILTQEPISLDRLFSKVLRNFEIMAHAKGLELTSIIPDDLPESVIGDRYRFRQILTNLIANAIKYTEDGSVSLMVKQTQFDDSVEIEVTVTDTGIGIEKEKQSSLFSPFEQGDSSYKKSAEGTGLGLAITKVLTETMNGSISVISEKSVGSSFSVTIPFQLTLDLPENIQTNAPVESRSYLEDDKYNILIAEDNKVNQLYLVHFLEKEGYNITIAVNGQEAVDHIKSKQFDAILMDIQMPVLSGLDATSQIRAFEETTSRPYTPIFALTASVTEHDRNRILSAGIDHFCPKPVDMRALLASLKRVLT